MQVFTDRSNEIRYSNDILQEIQRTVNILYMQVVLEKFRYRVMYISLIEMCIKKK